MPLITPGNIPHWCELEYFEIVQLPSGKKHHFPRMGRKEKLFAGKGKCEVKIGTEVMEITEESVIELPANREFSAASSSEEATLVRVCGRWGDRMGTCGVFTLSSSLNPQNLGDPAEYPRTTTFDNHYHDFDEYWIIFEGRGVVASEGKLYHMSAGDCLATGMGYHHDFPIVYETVRGVYLETTLEGRKRLGHLWSHRDGPPEPRRERV